MAYWLMKTEPDECSIDDFARQAESPICWDGVRNYQARNFMREMKVGDSVFIYHSSCKAIGIAGTVEVVKEAYPDPTQENIESNRWSAVDLIFKAKFKRVITLNELKSIPALAKNPLVQKGNRLSVIPFSQTEWNAVHAFI
ncbi:MULTISPECIES: EVE domain-containing protein [Gammaproteobacteria]|uniref:EVE domain-containing protein n=1 Tax=Gammaproteobacteria TaxID=1236 RepID=UPI000DCF9597|nr:MULTISPECIES: EVE domain-containing protein [Gammaproteobacteria]RTE86620.1 EVE domain-containing protein [Aliidiomarina sp. B3213]TCZ90825.1 EVE domain-containing protein [Lysobacter sp. N42]